MTTTKPAFKKISGSVAIDVDDWDVTENFEAEKPKEYLEFNTPPLALVVAMQEAGKESYEIYETLNGVGKMHGRLDIVPVITTEHQKRAADIYKHFQTKYTFRRIKGEYISKFMLAVDELCDNRKKIDTEHVRVLVSMPRFYEQNCALERIMKKYNSVKQIKSLPFAAFHSEIKFVERVHIKYGRKNEYHYFFSTPKNYLVRFITKKDEYGQIAWDALSKCDKLYIDTEAMFTSSITGYNFNVLQPGVSGTEIKI